VPVKLSWAHIKFEVEVLCTAEAMAVNGGKKYDRQEIVKDAYGYAAPGQTLYIMGSSGAGKTSLLNILSDRVRLINKATLSGNITINDVVPVNQENFARYAAYVMQDDVLFAHFTVKEALTFAARLKLTTDEAHQDECVKKIMQNLGLTHILDS
jgi:ABC-type multidrug transport system ATPase subunit